MFVARKFTILHIALCRLYQIAIYSEEGFVRVWYITPALATYLFSVYYFTNAGRCSNIYPFTASKAGQRIEICFPRVKQWLLFD